MKKLLSLFVLFFMGLLLFAQAPQKFSYQAVVRNESNNLVTNHTVGVRVSILQGGVNGLVVYQETHITTTNINGLMTLQIGGGTMLNGDFPAIDWANGPYFLKTETDPTGGTNYTIEGTQQLLSVPYALYAGSAANSFSGSYNDLTDLPQMPDIPTNMSALNNDAGYITMDSVPEIPTNVSAFVNDAGYITANDIPAYQILSISNDTIFLSNGGYAVLPAGFDGDYNSLTNRPNLFSGDYNDLTNQPQIPQIPTNVSAFTNDAGYITANDVPAYQVLSISNDTIFLSNGGYAVLPAGFDGDYNSLTNRPNLFSGDYNDLTNQPQIPQVPTNVSAFTNDAGYITANDIPAYQVLSISNDTIFLSDGGYAVLPVGFDGDYNSLTNRPNLFSGDYNDLTNQPQIPQVPTNVSAFTNDAGYITANDIPAYQVLSISNDTIFLSDGGYAVLPAGFDGDYNSLTNRPNLFSGDYNDLTNQPQIPQVPTNVSAFTNDAGYITAADVPAIPTNVSAFTNDAGYLTYYTEQQVLSISNDTLFLTGGSFVKLPAGFDGDYNSLTNRPNLFSGDYNDLTNQPQIPQVPANVSAFTNDAGYITATDVPAIPTNVSAFTNDAGYLTSATVQEAANIPTNVSAFTNDAGYLTSYTETDPQFNAWDKDYNDLINRPQIPEIPANVSAFNNDAGYITMDSIPAIPMVPTNVSAFTNDAGYLTSYTETDPQFNAWDKDYNDLINRPQIPQVPTNVSAFTNDAGYITMDAVPTIPTNVSAFTNDAGYVTESMLTTENYITQNDLITNNYITTADIPTNVSAFTNDAGYITMDSVPTIPTNVSAFTNDAGYVTESMLTTENYITQNDLITNNYVTTADIPTNVSAFTNDAGYITMDSIPAIPTVPTQVSAFENDAHYLTSYTETDPQFNAWNKDYNDLINRPVIPTIPTNVSTFTNDAGYITMDSIPAIPTVPTNVSAFSNDAGYITMDSVPAIPANVSVFTNDAGYLVSADLQTIQNDIVALQTDTIQTLREEMSDLMDSIRVLQQNLNDLAALVSALNVQMEQELLIATAGQTAFTLQHAPKPTCIIRCYINGVMVGSNRSGLLEIDEGNPQQLNYDASFNRNYTLKANDKVTFVYWY